MTTEMLPPGMGRCEITGRVLPEDELVTINGRRVSAEGKALLLEQLKSGEGLPGEAEKPTVLRRFACSLLDSIIVGVPMAIIAVIAQVVSIGPGATVAAAGVFVGAAQAVGVAIGVAYFTLLHGSGGRSVGKMAGSLKVVRMDGQPMDMKTAFIRAMAYQGPNFLTAIVMMVSVLAGQGVNVLVGIYGLANVIVALVDSQMQRAIHDRIAGTRVVMTPK